MSVEEWPVNLERERENAMTHSNADASTLRKELDAALAEVTAAEQALDNVLRDLRAGVRAEKVTITAAVEDAFARLRNSRAALAALRKLVEEL